MSRIRAVKQLLRLMLLISMLAIISSCQSEAQQPEAPLATDLTSQYEYQVGLGYGFLGKAVRVTVDGRDVISIIGTGELEQYAQLLGTKMLASGSSPEKDIMVRITVDGGEPYEQTIDLSEGMFVHIYQEPVGLRVFNTRFLVLE